jgi:hypothetical protein
MVPIWNSALFYTGIKICFFAVCFIDWQEAFDRVNWTKLMQILKGTGIDWREKN